MTKAPTPTEMSKWLEGKYLCISEDEPLSFDYVNQLSRTDSVRHSLV